MQLNVFPEESALNFKQCTHFIMEIFHLVAEGVVLKGVDRHCGNKSESPKY